MEEYTITSNQNIVDVCLQVYGTTELLFVFAKENGLRIDSDVSLGQVLTYDETLPAQDKSVLEQIAKRKLVMNNQINPLVAITDGVGAWIIESTFEVQ